MKTEYLKAETIFELTKKVEDFKPNSRILSVVYRVSKTKCIAIINYK